MGVCQNWRIHEIACLREPVCRVERLKKGTLKFLRIARVQIEWAPHRRQDPQSEIPKTVFSQ